MSADTFTPNRNYILMATGNDVGTWGVLLNAVITALDLNFGGRLSVALTDLNVTLTQDQCANIRHEFSGTLTGAVIVTYPATGGIYAVSNTTTGAYTVTLEITGGMTNYVLPQGATALVFTNPDSGAVELLGFATQTFTTHGILLGEASGAVASTSALTNGQLLVGQTGADPLPTTMSGDATLAASGAITIAAAAVTSAKLAPSTVNVQTGTSYTLQASDDNCIVVLTNSSSITATVPNSLPIGWSAAVKQGAAGQVGFAAASGATLLNASSQTHTRAEYSVVGLLVDANSGGSAAVATLFGDTA